MKKINYLTLLLLLSTTARAQNVGIGTDTPVDKLEVNGNVRSNGLLITNSNVIELGVGITKQIDNGKIGYNAFGEANTLSIVGGGTLQDGSDRRVKMWANGGTHFTGNVGIGTPAGPQSLILNSATGSNLSLRNQNANAAGVQTAVYFGGSSYTTASINAIGINNNAARLGFFTGYGFQGGVFNLRERLTIANNGNVGIGNTDPQQALDINGQLRFSGSSPAAFTLTLRGTMMFDHPFYVLDSTESASRKHIRIDHPYTNNNPNAIILVTPIGENVPLGVSYRIQDGFWYMQFYTGARPTGWGTVRVQNVCNDPSNGCYELYTYKYVTNQLFEKDISKWNILILAK